MSKKRGDVSPGVPDAPQEGVPLADLSGLTPEGEPASRTDPFRGKRGGGNPLQRAQYWWVGMDPSNGTVRILWRGKTRHAANKWMDSVRAMLVGTWNEVRLVRAKPVQPDKWGE